MKLLATLAVSTRAGLPGFDDVSNLIELADNDNFFEQGKDVMLQGLLSKQYTLCFYVLCCVNRLYKSI